MTRQQFKDQMRLNRGRLTSMEEELTDIYVHGIPELIDMALHTKLMGVERMAQLTALTPKAQSDFCTWVASHNNKVTKNQIDAYLLGLSHEDLSGV